MTESKVQHLIVLMLENRSFDHLLGYLEYPAEKQFEGIGGRENVFVNKTQDGRELRHYKRRWKVERFFAWLHNFRRVATRWDTKVALYEGFVKFACIIILARNLF